jgi:hypothetical protein
MSKVVKTQKVKPSGHGEDTMDSTKDGRLFILKTKKADRTKGMNKNFGM